MARFSRDLTIEQGATFHKKFTLKQSTDGVVSATDLSGATMRMQVRKKAGSPIIVELTSENGRIVITPLLGQYELKLSATETDALPVIDSALYDLELVQGDVVTRLMDGTVTVTAQITK